ncbi:NUDIX domain-containing protein [Actinomadura kijaniata]|uniref:8-oxo-dGTP pyrophosphatase MutT (NUDIX family) n=1 Tax=Actinomadura namibiensis TaxID=182080 RepID=A0A7W3LWQ4_ACTNM|nr:NUDIX domain-containing protein [Actinomadura namibiensis]MBA8955726.1 8-oxo-dGTP pyrophosphatase MutT (NUDIX family) [Actinomadura namibiensis]
MGKVIDKVAWVRVDGGRVLAVRSHGRELFYLPGGKREAGEDDAATLAREVREELGVELVGPPVHVGTWEAPADGRGGGVTVRMACYTADHRGTPRAAAEIAEIAWLGHGDRERVSAATRLVLDALRESGGIG